MPMLGDAKGEAADAIEFGIEAGEAEPHDAGDDAKLCLLPLLSLNSFDDDDNDNSWREPSPKLFVKLAVVRNCSNCHCM